MSYLREDLKGKKAILYSRVSTGDQVDGYSLNHQEERMKEFCARNGILVVKHYREEGVSAKNFNRPEFQKALKLIKKNRSITDYLFVLKWDRFSRNMTEAFAMLHDFEEYGVEVNATEQWIDYSDPNQLYMFSIYLAGPEVDNRNRSKTIKTTMRQARKEGRWVSTLPIGYDLVPVELGKSRLVPNDKAPFIREAFERVASGSVFSIESLRREMVEKGFECSNSTFISIFRKVVYCGKIKVEAMGKEPEEIVEGVHEGIVSEKLFEKARRALAGKPSTRVTQYDDSEDFVFRRFLWCESCQKYLTSSYSRGKSGKRHPYYHCQVQKGCGRYPTKIVHEAFEEYIHENYRFSPGRVALYKEIMQDIFAQNRKTKKGEQEALQSEIYQLDQKLLNLEVRFVEGDIDKTTFQRVKSRYESEILTLKERESSLELFKSDFEQFLDYGLSVVLNLGKLFRNETIEGKRIILGSMFGKKIIFQDGKVRTPEINQVLVFLSSFSKGENLIVSDKIAKKKVALWGGGPDLTHFEHLQRIIDLRKTISVTL